MKIYHSQFFSLVPRLKRETKRNKKLSTIKQNKQKKTSG